VINICKVITTLIVLLIFQFFWFGHKWLPIFKHVIVEFFQEFHRYILLHGANVYLFFQSHLSWDNNMFVSGPFILACVVLHLCADTHLSTILLLLKIWYSIVIRKWTRKLVKLLSKYTPNSNGLVLKHW
jgi:hypothetical protein